LVNATDIRSRLAVLLLTALVLTAAAWLRSAEYDEQYTLFLTAGAARPAWPIEVFPAAAVTALQAGHASFAGIAHDLRSTDVHPPLYFWVVAQWRSVFGPSLFAARLLSVLFGLGSIALVGGIARSLAIRPWLAMLLTLGCYGFVYTNAIARGFAPAELLILSGVALLLGRQPALAGFCLGAACGYNYLAVFPAAAVIAATGAWRAIPTAMPVLILDGWFFLAQHATRAGQFPAFELWPGLVRLIRYQVAAIFGGLPLYVDGAWRDFAAVALGFVTILLIGSILRAQPRRWILLAGAVGTPAGLLLLGAVFNNTPIELRYLSFGLPFVALLAAASLGRRMLALMLTIQLAGIAGLMLSPRTMQPAGAAAAAAASLAADSIVLVPAGNDGVGIVGAFGIEAPPTLSLLLIHPGDPIADRLTPYRRVALAALTQDRDSSAAVAAARAILTLPAWRPVASNSNLEVYQRGD
jgi:hypothetical protein